MCAFYVALNVLTHFFSPRQGETSDEVRLRGEPGLVSQIKDGLEKAVVALRDRVVVAVVIPAAQHGNIIGRGGQHLNNLQNRHGVHIQFPGSRGYDQVGEPSNASEVENADPADIIKVNGAQSACEAAIAEIIVCRHYFTVKVDINSILRVVSRRLQLIA